MPTSRAHGYVGVAAAAVAMLLASTGAHAKCDPTTEPDASDVANARAAVAAVCDCAGTTSHGTYMSCAAQQAHAVLVNPSCAGAIRKCASHSTCGRPGAVTCCFTTATGPKCKLAKDAAHCTTRQGAVVSCASCCNACPTPGAGPTCGVPTGTTATSTTTSSCPPATALYCGREGCGLDALCPAGMSCTDIANGCTCVGPPIACGDIVSGLSTEQCHWGTCPGGMTCGPVPKQGQCGYDCACQ